MNPHSRTPTLKAMDARSSTIRSVGYCRRSDKPVIESRITRQIFDAKGQMVETWDPRLWGAAPKPNLSTVHGLSGHPLLTDSVDAGWQLSLLDQAASLCSFWDGRGSQRHIDYDDQQRSITVTEQAAGERSRVVERLAYRDSDPAFALHNQCGRLIRHDTPASTQFVEDYGLAGSVLIEKCGFLIDLEIPDWPIQLDARDRLLEKQSFVTCYAFNAVGELQRLTDAVGNEQTCSYDLAGRLREAWLLLDGAGSHQRVVGDIHYNAQDQTDSETAGNGAVTRAEYSADDGRLIRLIAQVGSQQPLQDLHYRYDPVGNIVELEDQSQPISHFNNQRIDPISRYRYDSLYQLIEASGWEASQPGQVPALPDLLPTPLDPTQRRNYTQRFEYDAAGNLIARHHSGAPGFSMFTSARSNRSLAQREDGSLPGEVQIDTGFDACGNQRELQRGQAMTWDIRNQLNRVTLVKRANEPDDYECYVYDGPGHRLRKVHVSQTSNRIRRTEVRYLPSLEIHRQADGEERHVISVEAGRCSVRALHWPDGAHTDQLRYSLSDHLGSSTLELDHEAGVLTQEHYYPYGGTACWAGKSAVVAKYKTIRYSGKERDATGLYYYGYRYYISWLQRWASADPLGVVDGLNVYSSFGNNPIIFIDIEGTNIFDIAELEGDQVVRGSVVIDYEIPNLHPGSDLPQYLGRSQFGNSFSGLISVIPARLSVKYSGVVEMYPLRSELEWQTPYLGPLTLNHSPIIHGKVTSHEQAARILSYDTSMSVGFTFRDVRHLPIREDGHRAEPALVGRSTSMNVRHTIQVSDEFVSVGNNKDDFLKAESDKKWKRSRSLPLEVRIKLVEMFASVSDTLDSGAFSFKELFAAELRRPEYQQPEHERQAHIRSLV